MYILVNLFLELHLSNLVSLVHQKVLVILRTGRAVEHIPNFVHTQLAELKKGKKYRLTL